MMSRNISSSPSRGRPSPEIKNNNVNDIILSGAKKNFLSATDKVVVTKSPLKRAASPEKSTETSEVTASPKSLLKHPSISLGTPPKKQPKFWKTRWQEKINGRVNEKAGGKRKRNNEADKLLVDEGVIQMLNKVPSVFGAMPRSSSNTSSRAQRVRTTVNKQVQPQPAKIANKRQGSTDSRKVKLDVKQSVKIEPIEAESSSTVNGVSPKRAVRNISRDFSAQEVVAENIGSMMKDDDSFAHLAELPSEQLDLLMNCDIRYSLPKQGAPVQNKPSKSKKEDPMIDSKSSGSDSKKSTPESSKSSSQSLVKVKPVNLMSKVNSSIKLPPMAVNPTNFVENRLQNLLQHYEPENDVQDPDNLGPGQYNQIFLRFHDSFAQISITSNKVKLKGSLNPSIIDEITHALVYISKVKRFRGVLITGVGSVFCQGVDLHFLCQDHQERRKTNAAQMAAAIERLVMTMTTFPKLLVAAVNGDATGLGVTMLPLFDLVYANDKAMFNTYFSRLGQIPEGAASVTLPQFTSGLGGAVHEMILTGRHLTATEMMSAGLITQTFFPGRLMEEVIPRMKRACSESNIGLQWNKLLLKQHQKSQVEQVIGGETELLIQMWSSKPFHVNLVNFINSEKCLQFQKPS